MAALEGVVGEDSLISAVDPGGRRRGTELHLAAALTRRVAIAVARRHLLTSTYPWYRTLDGGTDPGAGLDVETMQRVSAATLAYDTVDDPENTIYLVDRPKEEKGRSRLTGPFTVESHSPYVHLPFNDPAGGGDSESVLGPARARGRRSGHSDIGVAASQDAERLLDALVSGPVRDANGREILQVAEVTPWPDGRQIHILGFDTYDPVSGEIRQSKPADVDCWMVDTDHDGTAFFPRLVYLPAYKRGDTQIKRLLKTLGRNLHPEAADLLCGLTSQPFDAPAPPHNVAVKIITRSGAEMTTTITPPR